MWTEAIYGISLANIDDLKYYQTHPNQEEIKKEICLFVKQGIQKLPFFYYVPLRIYAIFLGSFCLLTCGRFMNKISIKKRKVFIQRLKMIPFFDTLNKLIRGMIFLRLFDHTFSTKK
jgi:hypothetical protein